jgi:hypothetical protein
VPSINSATKQSSLYHPKPHQITHTVQLTSITSTTSSIHQAIASASKSQNPCCNHPPNHLAIPITTAINLSTAVFIQVNSSQTAHHGLPSTKSPPSPLL